MGDLVHLIILLGDPATLLTLLDQVSLIKLSIILGGYEMKLKTTMDEEVQGDLTELAEILYNFGGFLDIRTIKANIESFLKANHYCQLPEGKPPLIKRPRQRKRMGHFMARHTEKEVQPKPPLLTESQIFGIMDATKGEGTMRTFLAIRQAQRKADIKFYGGEE